jgi:hypothetical protein
MLGYPRDSRFLLSDDGGSLLPKLQELKYSVNVGTAIMSPRLMHSSHYQRTPPRACHLRPPLKPPFRYLNHRTVYLAIVWTTTTVLHTLPPIPAFILTTIPTYSLRISRHPDLSVHISCGRILLYPTYLFVSFVPRIRVIRQS